MKPILILILILFLIGCNDQTQKEKSKAIANELNLKLKNTSVIFQNIISSNDNIQDDFVIQNNDSKILIEPAFLESDLLDGKSVKFSNDVIQNVKITFVYDAVYYGEDKINKLLGFKHDTTLILKVIDKKIKIPSFENIKNVIRKKFEKRDVYDIAYLANRSYFDKIVSNYEDFGGKDSPDYKEAVVYLKKKNIEFNTLDQLFVKIDYTNLIIELEDQKKVKSTIIFDRMFQKYESSKQNKISDNEEFILPKGLFVLDSTIFDLKNQKYKILTLEKVAIKNKDNAQHNSNPIIVLREIDGEYYKLSDNYNLVFKYDDNCPADGYGGIVNKNNYFTIQQIFCMDFLFVNSYTTFKIEERTNDIYLHKYGEEYSDRSDPDKKIPTKIWTIKDFGVIKYENLTDSFLNELRQKKPIK
ncbi:MAG: hypothetical protein WAM46_05790 [Flavobacterium sp.]